MEIADGNKNKSTNQNPQPMTNRNVFKAAGLIFAGVIAISAGSYYATQYKPDSLAEKKETGDPTNDIAKPYYLWYIAGTGLLVWGMKSAIGNSK
ncbi:MAG: hypothetical protein AAB649_06220 [Patescibacteria group bacterium]